MLYPLSYEGGDVWAKVLEIRPHRTNSDPEGPGTSTGRATEAVRRAQSSGCGSTPRCQCCRCGAVPLCDEAPCSSADPTQDSQRPRVPSAGERLQHLAHGDVDSLVLADPQGHPSKPDEVGSGVSVPPNVAPKLLPPPLPVVHRCVRVLGTRVPKASLHEHHGPPPHERQVRTSPVQARKRKVNATAKAQRVECPPQSHLRNGVPAALRQHHPPHVRVPRCRNA